MESKIAPGFLVAAPHMRDPHFERSVVFMMEHDNNEGSLGLIVNRYADLDLARVFKEMDLPSPKTEEGKEPPAVLEGGPVAPQLGWIIHTLDWTSSESQIFGEGVAVTASLNILQAIADGKGPAQFLFCLGYSGWGPNQLVDEIKSGAWLNVPFHKSLLFDESLEDRWSKAIAKLGIDPGHLAPVMGDA